MEVERQRYEITGEVDERTGKIVADSIRDRPVGKVEKFEFGSPGDSMSQAIGGGYTSHWSPDFLQKDEKLGKNNTTCARFYFDKKLAVDIGDPESDVTRRKRKLLFRHGFGYLCIPVDFPQDVKPLKKLYQASIEEYYNYERTHPRPAVLQETVLIDSDGRVRRGMVTAIDTKVGGGITGSQEQQEKELLRKSHKLSKSELRQLKLQSKFHRRLRRAMQAGIPFRNPFVAKGKRLFPVQYSQ